MARRWTTREYEVLFRDHPPIEPAAPSGEEVTSLGEALDRTTGAIVAQWDDARSSVLGSQTAASINLVDFLRGRGWLG